jgi:catechol 2,3-dioxygenase-like lactoylglutathione lyase family enzyme
MGTLTQTQVTCMLPVKDLARARRFYEQQLGLEPLGAKPDGKFIYRCGGTESHCSPSPKARKPSTPRSASRWLTSAARSPS